MYRFDVYVNGIWDCSIESDSYKRSYYAARLAARCDCYCEARFGTSRNNNATVVCDGIVVYSIDM